MKHVLVDTSVWIDHLEERSSELTELLESDRVLAHPMVIGELACGDFIKRAPVIHEMKILEQAKIVSISEFLAFIEREKLYAQGCGLVDLSLLASTLVTPGAKLWTLDRRLYGLAERFGVLHQRLH